MLLNDAKKLMTPKRLLRGQLVFFKYKPQSKEYIETKSNKYYDKYPLVLVTEVYRDGFAGLNLHFLDVRHRNFLYEMLINDLPKLRSGEEWLTRLLVDYERLNARKQFRFFRPCYRRYSWRGIKRTPVVLPFQIWDQMVVSNTMKIERARPITIYRDSYKSIMRYRKK